MGRIGGFMAEPTSSQSFPGVSGVLGDPVGLLPAADIGQLRFDQALRGYRMDQVDEVVDALIARVRELEAGSASPGADGISPGFSRGLSPDVSPDVSLGDRGDTQEQ
ncbi:MAG: DivIVA domain-containing protein [Phycicoccus sp.]|nr:DivIVA domain-containing protein [Phycicoccus sp.]NMM33111.1 DivIVA domain-containing protein [Phycicoccus sp.]